MVAAKFDGFGVETWQGWGDPDSRDRSRVYLQAWYSRYYKAKHNGQIPYGEDLCQLPRPQLAANIRKMKEGNDAEKEA